MFPHFSNSSRQGNYSLLLCKGKKLLPTSPFSICKATEDAYQASEKGLVDKVEADWITKGVQLFPERTIG